MKYILCCCLLFSLLSGCKKDKNTSNTSKVEIYMLQSFVTRTDPATNPPTLAITNAVLSSTPLVADGDIEYYTKATTTFKLKKDISPIIRDYSTDKGFAVVVDGQPVYYGLFRSTYLSSMTIGVATIYPMLFINNELQINFVLINGSTSLQQLDRRNDPLIIDALSATGRLR